MDFRHLRYFVTAIECRSLSAAARRLEIGQPALGMCLKNLEDYLGVQLIRRHSRGIAPTDAGLILLEHAREVLESIDLMEQSLKGGVDPRGPVTVGVTESAAPLFLPSLFRQVRERHPDVVLCVVDDSSSALIDKVANRDVDLAIANVNGRLVNERVSSTILIRDFLYLISAPSLGLGRETIALADCIHYPQITTRDLSWIRRRLDEVYRQNNLSPQYGAEVQSEAMIKALVERGFGYAIMSASSVALDIRAGRFVGTRITDPDLDLYLCLIGPRRRRMTPAAKAVHDIVLTMRPTLD
jgi:LysR family nitrogen assimilation transcriptional regulator